MRKDRSESHLQINTSSRQIPDAEIKFNKRYQTNGFIDKNRQTKIVRLILCSSQSPINTRKTQMILLGAVKFRPSIGEMASCASRFYKQLTEIFASLWPFFNHLLVAALTVFNYDTVFQKLVQLILLGDKSDHVCFTKSFGISSHMNDSVSSKRIEQ